MLLLLYLCLFRSTCPKPFSKIRFLIRKLWFLDIWLSKILKHWLSKIK